MTHPPTWGHYPPQSHTAPPAYPQNPLEPMLWTRALDHLERIEARLILGGTRFDRLTELVTRLETRIESLETAWRKERPHRRWAHLGQQTFGLLRAIATPREWAMGAVIVTLAIKGIVAPEMLRAALLKFLSLE